MMKKKTFCHVLILLSGVSIFLTIGCASKTAPIENITSAEMAITVAQSSNAAVNDPLDLKIATDKLNQAKAAVTQEEFEKARRLADEAAVDAKLAEVKSLSEQAKKVAKELRDNIETLRREVERQQPSK